MTLPDTKNYVDAVKNGDRRMIAKTITLVESTHPKHRELARTIIDALLPETGKAVRLGITGVPGVGKSTFIESFGMMLVEKGHGVAVLTVDPSSTRSGGSILADKTRMERLCVHPRAFIRPSPSSGTLGGVARMTRETMLICEAAGFDVILVETVGVGQSETTVASMVDFFLVLMLAGAGDQLQGIKKGVLELADAVVINKADGANVTHAENARKAYEEALSLLTPASPTWCPPVLTCSAITDGGVDHIWDMIQHHREKMTATGELVTNRKKQAIDWMWSLIHEGLADRFNHHPGIEKLLPAITEAVKQGETSAAAAARELLFFLDNKPLV
ncbi:MAG: methylmalonyl Co-A mutase-associated GTPase MeaB [Desulfobacteraceae bacterium]|nr:methylmalonyl Co-A mutase-associated GTPase MeaB [Desulfobacteraceae bacterium]